MTDTQTPTILVIIGITGDLSKRKLLPALYHLAKAGALPEKTKLLGVTRREISVAEVLGGLDSEQAAGLEPLLEMCQMDLSSQADYEILKTHIASLEAELGGPAQHLFYLSVPPQLSQPIVAFLGQSGLSERAKLLLEKPFGTDLVSAQELIADIEHYFNEDQVYRIDHYLAKEMAQNLLVFRGANSLFARGWNHDYIAAIDIVAYEQIDIEGRSVFYEQTGALRDLVQSHLLQLAALTLMELPAMDDWHDLRSKRLAALQSLSLTDPNSVVRGQYAGYREAVDNPHSATETFVRLELHSRDPRWQNVPIRLHTGKALDQKTTAIHVTFRPQGALQANRLALRIQPHEGIELDLWAKRPGYGRQLEQVPLAFDYAEHYKQPLPEAYEQVLLDAMRSNQSLFTCSDEVLASWQLLQPVQQHWAMQGAQGLVMYQPGVAPDTVG